MKYQLLMLWTLAAFVSCADDQPKITVNKMSNGIRLTCGEKFKVRGPNNNENQIELTYRDENSGEYKCVDPENEDFSGDKIYVKFRTCDSCVELDIISLTGMVIGEVVATAVVGLAVYFIVSQDRTGRVTSKKKSSDKQHLVPNEMTSSPSADLYQPLGNQKRDVYDKINKK